MKNMCQWLVDEESVCGETATNQQQVPIALGATGVIFLCDLHKAKFKYSMAQSRRRREGYTRGTRQKKG